MSQALHIPTVANGVSRRRIRKWFLARPGVARLGIVILLFVIWEIAARFFVDKLFLSPPSQVFTQFNALFATNGVPQALRITVFELAVAFAISVAIGLAVGLAVGLVNGLGVAYLRVPSMIFTLGMNAVMRGLMVAHTGGFAPQTEATGLMRALATGHIYGIPNALFVWLAVSAVVAVILRHTALGRSIYALGNKEAAAYLAGVNTKGVTIVCFALCGLMAGLAGVLLAGYSRQAFQGMGDPFLLPAIAAVVIGGTNILGGRGRYLGTLVGVILIVLLNSVLSIMQMPEAGRQVIYGGVIILMLLVYGRDERVTS